MKKLLLTFFILFPYQAMACSCLELSLEQYYKRANAVFIGVAVKTKSGSKQRMLNNTLFKVQKVYKGDIQTTVEIQSASSSAACGMLFKKEQAYLIFTGKNNSAGICSGSREYPSEAWGNTEEEVDQFLDKVGKHNALTN